MSNRIATGPLIDAHGLSRFQIRVIVLCALVYVVDGYDTLAIGFVLPQLGKATNTAVQSFGSVFSTGVIGTLIGTVGFGIIGDYLGRKWSLIASCCIFGVFSLLLLLASSYEQLLALRFAASIGLGGATPIFVAMATEYAPKRLRGFAMSLVYAAFPLGGALAGLVSAFLVPYFGWTIMFLLGGIAPLAIALVLAGALPESIRFLIARGGQDQKVGDLLRRMDISIPAGAQFEASSDGRTEKATARQMLADLPAPQTALLWIMCLGMFMVIMTLAVWTPTLLKQAGFSPAAASLITSANLFGGIIGTVGAGIAFDRLGAKRAVLPQLLLTGILLALYGWASSMPVVLTVVLMLEGLFVAGATTCLLALAGTLYSTPVRTTGIGFALGAGRVGQVIGPMLIGQMLSANVTLPNIFLAASVPCFLATLAAAALFWTLGGRTDRPRVLEAARQ